MQINPLKTMIKHQYYEGKWKVKKEYSWELNIKHFLMTEKYAHMRYTVLLITVAFLHLLLVSNMASVRLSCLFPSFFSGLEWSLYVTIRKRKEKNEGTISFPQKKIASADFKNLRRQK